MITRCGCTITAWSTATSLIYLPGWVGISSRPQITSHQHVCTSQIDQKVLLMHAVCTGIPQQAASTAVQTHNQWGTNFTATLFPTRLELKELLQVLQSKDILRHFRLLYCPHGCQPHTRQTVATVCHLASKEITGTSDVLIKSAHCGK